MSNLRERTKLHEGTKSHDNTFAQRRLIGIRLRKKKRANKIRMEKIEKIFLHNYNKIIF